MKYTNGGFVDMFLKFALSSLTAIIFSAFYFVPDTPSEPAVKPITYQPELAKMVTSYLDFYHYEGLDLDDKISQRTLDAYIQDLDFSRMYFTAADIKRFDSYRDQLDDDILRTQPDISKPFIIYETYRQRLETRVAKALELLDVEPDFSVEEKFYYDRDKAPWAKDEAELDELWRKRIKEQMLNFKLRGQDRDYYVPLLKKRYERLLKNVQDTDAIDVMEVFLSALANSFDPHSSYLKPYSKTNFDIEMGHSFQGIGATLNQQGEFTVVNAILAGGPAERGGELQVGDKIIGVAQGEEPFEDVIDLRLDKVVQKIRGPKDSLVRLQVIEAGSEDLSQPKVIRIVRDRVEIQDQSASSEIKTIQTKDGKDFKLGVIEIPSFYLDNRAKFRGEPDYESTTRDVRKILDEFEGEEVQGVVIDLRRNGGGSLDEAIELTGLFIDKGPVVQVQSRKGQRRTYSDPDEKLVYDGPVMVLTSPLSASASEIFAGALQDYGRGLVVGSETTHGKGTVQNIIDLTKGLSEFLGQQPENNVGGALKITTHKFYRVSGSSTQHRGVKADIVLPSPYDGLKIREQDLPYALSWDTIGSATFRPYNVVNQYLDALRKRSTQRVNGNQEFEYLKKDLERRKENQERTWITLNYEKRKKEMETEKQLAEARKQERAKRMGVELKEGDDGPEPPDVIKEEALAIMADYLSLSNQWVAALAREN